MLSEPTYRDMTSKSKQRPSYQRLPLLELVARIVDNSDVVALDELHNHRLFIWPPNHTSLRLSEYLEQIQQSRQAQHWSGFNDLILDQAYDRTLNKFFHLPEPNQKDDPVSDRTDCRYYFRAFLDHAQYRLLQSVPTHSLLREIQVAGLLHQHVWRHFRLSCLESMRQEQQLVKRYGWLVSGQRIVLWMSVELSGSQCRHWLEQNIPEVDPSQPGERDRIQAIIHQRLMHRKLISLESIKDATDTLTARKDTLESLITEEIFAQGLAQTVAREKADTLDQQRPTIEQLGSARLQRLIRQIFQSLAEGNYRPQAIAAEFGLSPSALSRFAGLGWNDFTEQCTDPIPDLWRNTAQLLARHSDFIDAAQKAGIWQRVVSVLESPTQTGGAHE